MATEQNDQEKDEQSTTQPESQLGVPHGTRDSSFDLAYALLAELKESFGRVDERTKAISDKTTEITTDLREIRQKQGDLVTDKFAWRIVKIVLSVVAIITTLVVGIIYFAVSHHSHQQSHTPAVVQESPQATPPAQPGP